MSNELSEQEAWTMPLEEIEARVEELDPDARAFYAVSEEEMALAIKALGPPIGVGLPEGLYGEEGEAFPGVGQLKGDHIAENSVSRRGLRRLKILRMGSPVDPLLYVEQIRARLGAKAIRLHEWVDDGGGQALHYLMIFWKEA